MLPWREIHPSSPAEISDLMAHRQVFAVLLQRSGENLWLRRLVADTIAISNVAPHDEPALDEAARAAPE
ncbi:hypothetical protein [Streptomyces sp. NPDC056401]|uniref:hypothetical protein n=1 Tax=Streptomyces sp. NPDC056401 TaxID=3345809 RepID=UPI0035D7E3E1